MRKPYFLVLAAVGAFFPGCATTSDAARYAGKISEQGRTALEGVEKDRLLEFRSAYDTLRSSGKPSKEYVAELTRQFPDIFRNADIVPVPARSFEERYNGLGFGGAYLVASVLEHYFGRDPELRHSATARVLCGAAILGLTAYGTNRLAEEKGWINKGDHIWEADGWFSESRNPRRKPQFENPVRTTGGGPETPEDIPDSGSGGGAGSSGGGPAAPED